MWEAGMSEQNEWIIDENEWIVIAMAGGDGAVDIVTEAEAMLTGLEYWLVAKR
jgi:hypothetical protein